MRSRTTRTINTFIWSCFGPIDNESYALSGEEGVDRGKIR